MTFCYHTARKNVSFRVLIPASFFLINFIKTALSGDFFFGLLSATHTHTHTHTLAVAATVCLRWH